MKAAKSLWNLKHRSRCLDAFPSAALPSVTGCKPSRLADQPQCLLPASLLHPTRVRGMTYCTGWLRVVKGRESEWVSESSLVIVIESQHNSSESSGSMALEVLMVYLWSKVRINVKILMGVFLVLTQGIISAHFWLLVKSGSWRIQESPVTLAVCRKWAVPGGCWALVISVSLRSKTKSENQPCSSTATNLLKARGWLGDEGKMDFWNQIKFS